MSARRPRREAKVDEMNGEPEREQNWYPISKLDWFTDHMREGVEATRAQMELLQPARARPYVLDYATVAHVIRVHRDQADDLTLFQNQADRWKTDSSLTDAQRAGVAAYETLIAELGEVNSDVLAVAAELSDGTIEVGQIRPPGGTGGVAAEAARVAIRSGLGLPRNANVRYGCSVFPPLPPRTANRR